MPELPDVEGFRRHMAEHLPGQRVVQVEAPRPEAIRNTTPQGLGRALNGRTLDEPRRHGKWVLTSTDGGGGPTLVLHFGMTGYPTWSSEGQDRHEHDRVVFVCEDGELRFNCMRMFGGVWLASDDRELHGITGPLGPDAAEVDRDELAALLDGRRGGVKSALMDQELIAGVGNIVADEVLWRARVHPRHQVPDLDDERIDSLHGALEEVVRRSIEHGQVPRDAGWLTRSRDVDDPDCPRCGAGIAHGEVNSRTTYWCPECQPAPGGT